MPLAVGESVVVRDMHTGDLDAWAHWMQPGHRWRELDGPYYQSEPTEQWIAQAVSAHRARIQRGTVPGVRTRAMIARRSDDALIGHLSRYWISEATHWAALGLVLYDPTQWRHGYGRQALGLWTQYQFDQEPSFARLDLRTWSGNAGMIGLARSLGYQQEACFRMARIVNGEYFDGLGYGVLRSEWDERYPGGFGNTP